MGTAQSSLDEGKLVIAYSGKSGSTVGIEFSSVTSGQARLLMGACSVAASETEKRIVTSLTMGDTEINQISDDAGGDNMERRVAVLEAEVTNIKRDLSDIKYDVSKIQDSVANTGRDMAVVLQKLVDIDSNLSKKPSSSDMTAAIATATNKQILWTISIAIAILGIAKWLF